MAPSMNLRLRSNPLPPEAPAQGVVLQPAPGVQPGVMRFNLLVNYLDLSIDQTTAAQTSFARYRLQLCDPDAFQSGQVNWADAAHCSEVFLSSVNYPTLNEPKLLIKNDISIPANRLHFYRLTFQARLTSRLQGTLINTTLHKVKIRYRLNTDDRTLEAYYNPCIEQRIQVASSVELASQPAEASYSMSANDVAFCVRGYTLDSRTEEVFDGRMPPPLVDRVNFKAIPGSPNLAWIGGGSNDLLKVSFPDLRDLPNLLIRAET